MTTTPATKPDDASAVDSGAIDLEKIRALWATAPKSMPQHDQALIAAVEALREREKQTLVMIADMLNGEMKLSRRVEAAEARVVELVGALEGLLDAMVAHNEANERVMVDPHSTEHARTVLAATPAKALERARAVENVAKEAKRYADDRSRGNGALNIALAKLDALDKEEK